MTVSISYGDDYDVARKAILDILSADSRIMQEPAPFVALGSLGDSAVKITIRVWTASEDYWGVYFDLNEKFYKELPAKGVNFPYPHLDVQVTEKK